MRLASPGMLRNDTDAVGHSAIGKARLIEVACENTICDTGL